jgi:uncharacterized protein (DUF58 family)
MWGRKNREPRTKNQEVIDRSGSQFLVLGSHLAPDALLKRVQWAVLRPLATLLGGDERSLLRGPGMELAEVRPYQPGDDVRHIDWNITARTEQPFVREAHAERALDVWLLLDISASIDWGTAQCVKRERLLEFAAVAGQILGGRGHRVGALLFADRPLLLVPPAAGRVHLQRLLGSVRGEARQARRGSTDLGAAFAKADVIMRRRGLVLVMSDFLAENDWQPALRRLTQRHEVIAVRLHDPRERELPDVGLITLEDPETGDQLQVNTADRKLRERFAAAAAAQIEQLQRALAACGADQLAIGTDEALLPALLGFLAARRQRRAAGARRGGEIRV